MTTSCRMHNTFIDEQTNKHIEMFTKVMDYKLPLFYFSVTNYFWYVFNISHLYFRLLNTYFFKSGGRFCWTLNSFSYLITLILL